MTNDDVKDLTKIIMAEGGLNLKNPAEYSYIGSTVLNRTEHSGFPKTISKVIRDKKSPYYGYGNELWNYLETTPYEKMTPKHKEIWDLSLKTAQNLLTKPRASTEILFMLKPNEIENAQKSWPGGKRLFIEVDSELNNLVHNFLGLKPNSHYSRK